MQSYISSSISIPIDCFKLIENNFTSELEKNGSHEFREALAEVRNIFQNVLKYLITKDSPYYLNNNRICHINTRLEQLQGVINKEIVNHNNPDSQINELCEISLKINLLSFKIYEHFKNSSEISNYYLSLPPDISKKIASIFYSKFEESQPQSTKLQLAQLLPPLKQLETIYPFCFDASRHPLSVFVTKANIDLITDLLLTHSFKNISLKDCFHNKHQVTSEDIDRCKIKMLSLLNAPNIKALPSNAESRCLPTIEDILKSTTEDISKGVQSLLMSRDYLEATSYINRVLEVQEKAFGKNHPDYIKSLIISGDVNRAQENYQEAERKYVEGLELGSEIFANDPFFGKILRKLASVQKYFGNWDEALKFCERARDVHYRILGNQHPETLKTMFHIAVICVMKEEKIKAKELLIEVLDIQKRVLGSEHQDSIMTMTSLAEIHGSEGKYDIAKKLFGECLSLGWKVFPDTPLFAGLLNYMGTIETQYQNYNAALLYFERAITIQNEFYSMDHYKTLDILLNLAETYKNLSQFKKAENLLLDILKIRNEKFGQKHIDYIRTQVVLAGLYRIMGNFQKAKDLYVICCSIGKELIPNHSLLAVIFSNLGSLEKSIGNPNAALSHLQEALKILETKGEDDPQALIIMNNIATIHANEGRYEQALQMHSDILQRKIKYYRGIGDDENLSIAKSYNNIGVIHQAKQEFDKALKNFEAAYKIHRKKAPDGREEITALQNLAMVHKSKQNYPTAIAMYERSLELSRKFFGEESAQMATSLNDISVVHFYNGSHAKAIELATQALNIRKMIFKELHPDIASSLLTFGAFHQFLAQKSFGEDVKKNFDLATQFYKDCLIIRKKILNEGHPDICTATNNLATIYTLQGLNKEALKAHADVLKFTIATFGENHINTSISYINIASAYNGMKKYEKALKYAQKSLSIRKGIFERELKNLEKNSNKTLSGPEFNELKIKIAKNIHLADPLLLIGNLYFLLKENKNAEKNYREAIIIDPTSAGYQLALGNLYSSMEQHKDALWYFKQANELQSTNVLPSLMNQNMMANFSKIANACFQLFQYDDAEEYYIKALAISPKNDQFHEQLGSVYYAMKRFNGAIWHYKRALEIRSKEAGSYAQLHVNLANVYRELDWNNEAEEHYLSAIASSPESYKIHKRIGDFYQSIKQFAGAVWHLKKSVEIQERVEPVNTQTLIDIGDSYFMINKYEDAIKYYTEVLNFCPDSKNIQNKIRQAKREMIKNQ